MTLPGRVTGPHSGPRVLGVGQSEEPPAHGTLGWIEEQLLTRRKHVERGADLDA